MPDILFRQSTLDDVGPGAVHTCWYGNHTVLDPKLPRAAPSQQQSLRGTYRRSSILYAMLCMQLASACPA